jgi:predicted CXXCH cytochrome family protein
MRLPSWAIGVLAALALVASIHLAFPPVTQASSNIATASGDAACAGCHREIYDRYRNTPMSLGSGPAADGLIPGSFLHQPSGVEYKVFLRDQKAWLSYDRANPTPDTPLHGERQLRYFIGSGHRGRTYLYEESGLWFEAPINYYSKKALWDMAPNFESSHSMPDGLPVDPNCLHCHASELQPSLPSARNRYATVPFLQGGIRCSACHGDPAAHLAQQGHGPILNPAKLSPAKRDSVCLQCHLEGDAAIYLPGKSLAAFKPGDDLAASVTYFVKASAESGGNRAASQWEALLRSRCKIASGDKLTCTTCHDPHGSPSESERVAYFRSKCLTCHNTPQIALNHHPEQQDCAVCHMPARKTSDISHEQTTDHDIQRYPFEKTSEPTSQLHLTTLGDTAAPSYSLVPVGNIKSSNLGDHGRALGLAYAQAALSGNESALRQALPLLLRAEASGANDAELHAQLGLIEQLSRQYSAAFKEYGLALAVDPGNTTALGNKAVLLASSGQAPEAMRLLQLVVHDDPSQSSASLNLAFMQCVSGDPASAHATLESLRRFSPDDPALQTFLHQATYAGHHCDTSPTTAPMKP